jgi:phage N-6-adenine-methyltransferase
MTTTTDDLTGSTRGHGRRNSAPSTRTARPGGTRGPGHSRPARKRAAPRPSTKTPAATRTKSLPPGSAPNDDRPTPKKTFDKLNREFGFTLDAAASAENAKCTKFYDVKTNGLAQDWSKDVVWLNPPYGAKVMPMWAEKARTEARKGATVVMLAQAYTHRLWFVECIQGAHEVRFFQRTIAFGNSTGAPAPFGSVLIIYRPGKPPREPKVTFGHNPA